MLELAASFYVAGIAVSAIIVAAVAVWLAFLFTVSGLVSLAERVRVPRMKVGTWRGMGGFSLRLLALLCVVAGAAALLA